MKCDTKNRNVGYYVDADQVIHSIINSESSELIQTRKLHIKFKVWEHKITVSFIQWLIVSFFWKLTVIKFDNYIDFNKHNR